MYCIEKKGNECSKRVRVVQKKCGFEHVALFTPGSRLSLTSRTAAALVRCSFADTALGAPGTAHGAAGAAALLAGGAFAVFAFAGAGAGAGVTWQEEKDRGQNSPWNPGKWEGC